jgi:hypothetical protein
LIAAIVGNETNTGNAFNKQKCSMIPVSSESYGKFILNCNNINTTNNRINNKKDLYLSINNDEYNNKK